MNRPTNFKRIIVHKSIIRQKLSAITPNYTGFEKVILHASFEGYQIVRKH